MKVLRAPQALGVRVDDSHTVADKAIYERRGAEKSAKIRFHPRSHPGGASHRDIRDENHPPLSN